MTKNELIENISRRLNIPKHVCKNVLNELILSIKNELLCGGDFNISKFGKFYVKEKKPRVYFSPLKNGYLKSKYKCVVEFLPSKCLKIDVI